MPRVQNQWFLAGTLSPTEDGRAGRGVDVVATTQRRLLKAKIDGVGDQLENLREHMEEELKKQEEEERERISKTTNNSGN